jgi:hypothetical protein
MLNRHFLLVTLLSSLCISACSKKDEAPAADLSNNAAQASSVIAEAVNTQAQVQTQVEAAVEDPEIAKKRKAMEFALKEDEIKNDPKGQWAVNAKASTSYGDLNNPQASYHPMQATGVPDVDRHSDDSSSWATKEADAGIEWIELDYAKPVNATEIRIRQTFNPGAIIKVELFDESGAAQNVWQGPDVTNYPENEIVWLNVAVEKTAYKTQKVKITLATNAVNGWNEIDAVQLIGE